MTMHDLQHVAIILDGNRTWAQEQGLPKFLGHTEGAKNIKKIVLAALEHDISFLTLYTLSTENLRKRETKELEHLFSLFQKMESYLDLFQKHSVRFCTIGDISKLPEKVQKSLNKLKEKTKNNTFLIVTFAINYGGRDEIIRAIQRLPNAKSLNEESFTKYLDTKDLPDVDLVIRTGGYHRLSNFLPWQSTYAELYFTDIKWPTFSPGNFTEAVKWFSAQKRKEGR